MRKFVLALLATACTMPFLVGAGRQPKAISETNSSDQISKTGPAKATSPPSVLQLPETGADWQPTNAAAAPLYNLSWYSVNSGGSTNLPGTNLDLGLTVGEPLASLAEGTRFDVGFGFWYGAVAGACPISLPGDVNLNSTLSTSDIIVLVNFVLKGGPEPMPCIGNGDLNCNGTVSLSDIVVLINKVLKGGPNPCNVCDVIPSLWSCP
jgi:hypothetical protein